MADRWAVASGNWSSTATWNGGTLPTAADDVFADGFTVTIDQNVTVLSIRNTQRTGGTLGGVFYSNGTRIINANIVGRGNTALELQANSTTTITGQITPPASGVQSFQTAVVLIRSGATATITSPTFNGSSSGNAASINIMESSTNVTLIGNVGTNGVTLRNDNAYQTTLTFLTVIGNVAGSGIYVKDWNTSNTVTFTINGSLAGLTFTNSTIFTVILNGNLTYGSDGSFPITTPGTCRLLIHPTNTLQHDCRVNNGGVPGVTRSLYTGGVNLNQPAVTNVRSGTVYGASNEFTGTCAVPPAGSVALGVPVDNTTGTGLINQTVLQAALEAALAPNAANIVERSTNDNKAITFSWPVSGATITGQKSIDNGAYSAVAGAITFLRTESNRHYYALAYNAADRNTVESSIRYKMTDGTYTKYFNLHVVPSGDVNVTVSPLTAEQEPRNTRSRIIVYTGEGGTQYFYAIDSAGNSLNLTGFNLELRFAKGKSVIYTAKTSDGSLTVSNNNQVTFTRSAALTRGDGELTYALRNMGAGEEVLLDGPVTVRYAP